MKSTMEINHAKRSGASTSENDANKRLAQSLALMKVLSYRGRKKLSTLGRALPKMASMFPVSIIACAACTKLT